MIDTYNYSAEYIAVRNERREIAKAWGNYWRGESVNYGHHYTHDERYERPVVKKIKIKPTPLSKY